MIVSEGFGERPEVFGGSRISQEGRNSTKRCTCPCFGASQEVTPPQRRLQVGSRNAPGRLRGMLPEASRASLMIIVCCLESLACSRSQFGSSQFGSRVTVGHRRAKLPLPFWFKPSLLSSRSVTSLVALPPPWVV